MNSYAAQWELDCEIAISGTQRLTTTYYYANGQRVAMRTAAGVTYIHADHPSLWLRAGLGSTAVTSGAQTGNTQYFPYGATRSGAVSTAYKFTGQRLDSDIRCRREDVSVVGPWMYVEGDHRVALYILIPPT